MYDIRSPVDPQYGKWSQKMHALKPAVETKNNAMDDLQQIPKNMMNMFPHMYVFYMDKFLTKKQKEKTIHNQHSYLFK